MKLIIERSEAPTSRYSTHIHAVEWAANRVRLITYVLDNQPTRHKRRNSSTGSHGPDSPFENRKLFNSYLFDFAPLRLCRGLDLRHGRGRGRRHGLEHPKAAAGRQASIIAWPGLEHYRF